MAMSLPGTASTIRSGRVLQKIYGWYNVADRLAFAHGSGTLFGKPEGTGCANIGPVQRKPMYPVLKNWFGMKEPDKEVQSRRPDQDLLCLTPEMVAAVKPLSVQQLAQERAAKRLAAVRKKLEKLEARGAAPKPVPRPGPMPWAASRYPPSQKPSQAKQERLGEATVERIVLEIEPGIVVPLLLLTPSAEAGRKLPVVVGVSQEGKQMFLAHRAHRDCGLASQWRGGLPAGRARHRRDAGSRRWPGSACRAAGRGPGESAPAPCWPTRSKCSAGRLLGDRLRDLRSVLAYLRRRSDLDATRLGLWGASSRRGQRSGPTAASAVGRGKAAAPSRTAGRIAGAASERCSRRMFAPSSWKAVWRVINLSWKASSVMCHTMSIVPGVLTAGDLCDVTAALAPRGVWLHGMVDGLNRPVPAAALGKMYATGGRHSSDGRSSWCWNRRSKRRFGWRGC